MYFLPYRRFLQIKKRAFVFGVVCVENRPELHKPHCPMKKILLFLCVPCMCIALAHAAILAEDSFDYALGSAPTTWTGGSGFSGRWNVANDAKLHASIVTGLTFGSMPVSGNALYCSYSQNAGSLGGANIFRSTDLTASSGELWLSYLFQFDTAASVNSLSGALAVRLDTSVRGGVNETNSGLFVQYNEAATKAVSSSDGMIKGGTTLLLVFAYDNLGDSAGSAAKGWALTASGYEALIQAGITISNLDDYAILSVSTSTANTITLADPQFVVAPSARGNGTVMACTIDEIKVGSGIGDVIVAIPESAAASLMLSLSVLALVLRRRC